MILNSFMTFEEYYGRLEKKKTLKMIALNSYLLPIIRNETVRILTRLFSYAFALYYPTNYVTQ